MPLLFTNTKDRFSCVEAQIIKDNSRILNNVVMLTFVEIIVTVTLFSALCPFITQHVIMWI